MAFVKSNENATHITFDYRICSVYSRESALQWLAKISHETFFKLKRIDVDDFESYHDGTVSNTLSKIADDDEFVTDFVESEIKSASIIGEFKGNPFVLSVSLDSSLIGLSCRKSKIIDYKELERLLNLV